MISQFSQGHIFLCFHKDTYYCVFTRTHITVFSQGHIFPCFHKDTYFRVFTRTHITVFSQGHIFPCFHKDTYFCHKLRQLIIAAKYKIFRNHFQMASIFNYTQDCVLMSTDASYIEYDILDLLFTFYNIMVNMHKCHYAIIVYIRGFIKQLLQ